MSAYTRAMATMDDPTYEYERLYGFGPDDGEDEPARDPHEWAEHLLRCLRGGLTDPEDEAGAHLARDAYEELEQLARQNVSLVGHLREARRLLRA